MAGALAFADGVRLVRERGRLMAEAGRQQPGAMAAILGLDTDAVRSVCAQAAQQAGRPLVLANDNCPGQVVISGDDAALELGMTLAKEAGAKRAIKLAVSIAAHSPLMQSASTAFNAAVAATPFAQPRQRRSSPTSQRSGLKTPTRCAPNLGSSSRSRCAGRSPYKPCAPRVSSSSTSSGKRMCCAASSNELIARLLPRRSTSAAALSALIERV
ncbi:MAG: acyltransferase domain-containing protein [Chloroflexi bacterium]|nr:acyltransferase domain-containing protein [Chloroflexota bacterium]